MKKSSKIGEVYNFSDGSFATIISECKDYRVKIKFSDGTIQENVSYYKFRVGNIKNRNKKIHFGVGFIGYGSYIGCVSDLRYRTWRSMLERCYGNRKSKKSYKNCTVDDKWHNFQNFAKWFDENYINGFHLDKDILIKGNKVYSEKTCCFVPVKINGCFVLKKLNRGNFPLGMCMDAGKLKCVINKNGKSINLGRYINEKEAFEVYKKEKESYIKELANEYKGIITDECYSALLNWKIEIND